MSNIDYTSKVIIWGEPSELGSFIGHSLHRFGLSLPRFGTTPGLKTHFDHLELLESLAEIGIDTDQAKANDTMIRMEMCDYVDDSMIIKLSQVYPDLTFWSSWVAWAWDGECDEDDDSDHWPLADTGGVTVRAGFALRISP